MSHVSKWKWLCALCACTVDQHNMWSCAWRGAATLWLLSSCFG